MNKGLTHVKGGDRLEIRAPVWNKMLDAARGHQARQHSTGSTPGPDFRGVPVLIKNNSGYDRSQYDILGISGVVFAATDDGFKQRIVLTGVTPATGSHEGKFAVLAEPINDGEIGPAILDGTTICQVNITDATHKYADIANGDAAKLVSAKSGPVQIIWIESGTGTKWAVVRIGIPAATSTAPAGATIAYAGDTVPTGYLLCDGTAVSRTIYAALFTAIGTLWGPGDGSTTFNLPDSGELSIRGWKSGSTLFGTVGNTGGVAILDLDHTHYNGDCVQAQSGTGVWCWEAYKVSGVPNWTGARSPPAVDRPNVAFGTDEHEVDNRGPYGVYKWIIKT